MVKRKAAETSESINIDSLSKDDIDAAIRIGQILSKNPELFDNAELQGLRKAWGPIVYQRGKKIVEQDAAKAEERDKLSKAHRDKHHDKKLLDTRKLRMTRIQQLNALKESQDATSMHLCIPDGAVDDGVNTNFGQSGGASNVVQVLLDKDASDENQQNDELNRPRSCYRCKARFVTLHHFYDQLCPPCAELNWEKRMQTANMSGAVVLLTGGRVKIGYQIGLKLLRMGARLLVTTRFPADAALRYCKESDYDSWANRLKIFELDFRNIVATESFAANLHKNVDRLDVIINNACQTIRRPEIYYDHLRDTETKFKHSATIGADHDRAVQLLADQTSNDEQHKSHNLISMLTGALSEEDSNPTLFPKGALDVNAQQIDLRTKNSWLLTLSEVSTTEVLEVLAVNTVAPLVLNAKLKPFLVQTRLKDQREGCTDRGRYIINVSAMEGKFYRHKTPNHPHTNMAKAALNMMTRTSSQEYANDGIYMNSVDTGWINDENPLPKAAQISKTNNFQTPIDEVDAASRVLDPVIVGFNGGDKPFGLFIKDYKETEW